MNLRLAGVFAVAAVFCVPALAESYALVTFDQPSTDPYTYATQFATFYGGTVGGSPGQGYIYGASSSNVLHLGSGVHDPRRASLSRERGQLRPEL